MAVLHNDTKNLRLFLELVDREVLPVVPGQPSAPPEAARVLGTAGVEFYDRRDKSFWPFIRLPVLYLSGQDAPALVDHIRHMLSTKGPGLAFRTGNTQELALQLGKVEGQSQLYAVEVGIDLAPYLLETSGAQAEPGRDLAMFRFTTTLTELVVFADQVKQELSKLPPLRGGATP